MFKPEEKGNYEEGESLVAKRMNERVTVFIVAPFPTDCVERIKAADPRADIIYDDTLMPKLRYPADRVGHPLTFTAEMEEKWRGYLARADILLGFDRPRLTHLTELAPRLRWIQATSTAVGPVVKELGWDEKGLTVTSASGIHAVPIAEFVIMSLLAFTKDIFHLFHLKQQKAFQRYCTGQLQGKTLGIVGLGKNGTEVARRATALGMRVLGIKRNHEGANPATLGVDQIYPKDHIHAMLGQCDFVSLTVPTTPETHQYMDDSKFKAMPPGSVLINNSMGTIVNEEDLIRALQEGHLGGAALDVFAKEPLDPQSPLWEMDNVLLSPHSASCAQWEDAKMTDLFIDNLRRYLDGLPLRNVIDPERQY